MPGVVLKEFPESNATFSWRVSLGRRAAKLCSLSEAMIVTPVASARNLGAVADSESLRLASDFPLGGEWSTERWVRCECTMELDRCKVPIQCC